MKKYMNIQDQSGDIRSQKNVLPQLKTPLFLIGFMGVGKSSVAIRLGQMLHVPVQEMDDYIEDLMGMSIPEIFSQHGEELFREVESIAVVELRERGPRVISCGGGVPLREVNVNNMKAGGKVLLLTAKPETVFRRVRHSRNRPLLNGHMNLPYITHLMEQRRECYEQAADFQVNTDEKTVEEISLEIMSILAEIQEK